MKSSFALRMMCNMCSDLSQLRSRSQSKIRRVTTSAVNKLTVTPMVRVTPKPLTGPVPRKIRITEEMSVVMLESKMVLKALS